MVICSVNPVFITRALNQDVFATVAMGLTKSTGVVECMDTGTITGASETGAAGTGASETGAAGTGASETGTVSGAAGAGLVGTGIVSGTN